MNESKKIEEFTEEDFERAVSNASYWAKRRVLKKLDKVVYRKARWFGMLKTVVSPLTGKEFQFLLKDEFSGVVRSPERPGNQERVVTNFVLNNLGDNHGNGQSESTQAPEEEALLGAGLQQDSKDNP